MVYQILRDELFRGKHILVGFGKIHRISAIGFQQLSDTLIIRKIAVARGIFLHQFDIVFIFRDNTFQILLYQLRPIFGFFIQAEVFIIGLQLLWNTFKGAGISPRDLLADRFVENVNRGFGFGFRDILTEVQKLLNTLVNVLPSKENR